MGKEYSYKCEKCNETVKLTLGSGMFMLEILEDLIEQIRRGEFGEKCKKYFAEHPDEKPDINLEAYQCEKCRYIFSEIHISDSDEAYDHNCKLCGGRTQIISKGQSLPRRIRCRKCNEEMETVGMVFFD